MGRMTSRVDGSANQTVMAYSDAQTTVTLPSGQIIYYVKTGTGYSLYTADPKSMPAVQTIAVNAAGQITSHTYFSEKGEQAYQVNYTYGANGLLQAVQQADGTSLSFTYDDSHRLSSIEDGAKRTEALSYSAGQCTTTNALGQATQYGLDASRQIATLTNAAGEQTKFSYHSTGLLETITRAEQDQITLQYDDVGQRVISQMHTASEGVPAASVNQTEQFMRDASGRIQNRILQPVSSDPSQAQVSRFVYDAKGNLIFKVSATGGVTQYGYDAKGNRTTKQVYLASSYDLSTLAATDVLTAAQLTAWVQTQPKNQVRLTQWTYDVTGQVQQETAYSHLDSAGHGVLDSSTQVAQYTWDAYARETTKTVTLTGSAFAVTTKQYDGIGRPTLLAKPNHDQISWTYDDAHSTVIKTLPTGLSETKTVDAGGLVAQIIESDAKTSRTTAYQQNAAGRLFQITLPDGQTQYQLHNLNGRLAYSVDALGCVTAYQYDANGHSQSTTRYVNAIDPSTLKPTDISISVATNVDDRTTYTLYNKLGQLHYEIDAAGAVVEYQYDDTARKVATIHYATLADATQTQALIAGTAIPLTSSDDRSEYLLYDANGRVYMQQDAAGYLTQFDYDRSGREIHRVRYATPTTRKTFSPTPDDQHDAHHYRFYDGVNKIGEINAEGAVTQYIYDQAGRALSKIQFVTPVKVPVREPFSSLLPAPDSEDAVEQYTYDALGRRTQVAFSNTNVHQQVYDAGSHVVQAIKTDKAATQTRVSQQTFNAYGQVLIETNPRGGVTAHAYDDSGLCLSTTDPLGHQTVFYYNVKRQLVASIDANGCVKQFAYNSFGEQAKTRTFINKLTSVQIATLTGGFVTDAVSQLLFQAESDEDIIHTKTFDFAGREAVLVDGEGYSTTLTYNAFGECVSKTEAVDHDGAVLTHQFQYESRGLLDKHELVGTDKKTTQLLAAKTYDMHGRVSTDTDGIGAMTHFVCDRLGRRVSKTNALSETRATQWDTLDRKVEEVDGEGQATKYTYQQAARSHTKTLPTGATVVTVFNCV